MIHEHDEEVHFLGEDLYYISKKYDEELKNYDVMQITYVFFMKAYKFVEKKNLKIKDLQFIDCPTWKGPYLSQHGFFSLKFQVESKQEEFNNESALDRLKILRTYYDMALNVCDPITYALRQQNLLHEIAEYLIKPLQEHELAERSKLKILEKTEEED